MKTPGEKRRRRMYNRAKSQGWLAQHAAAQKGRCALCGEPFGDEPDRLPSLDHVIPLSVGGFNTIGNTQAAHVGCNNIKGNLRQMPKPATVASLRALQAHFA